MTDTPETDNIKAQEMKTKSCPKCSPQGKRCDCPTESEGTALGPSDETPCYRRTWYDRRDLLAQIGILERERDELRRTNEELQLTFDLRRTADRRAIKRWQAAHPGNDLTWPDHADMVVWLMERYSPERVLADRLAALLQRNRDGYGGQMVDPECGCCDCKWLQPIDEALAAWKEARSET